MRRMTVFISIWLGITACSSDLPEPKKSSSGRFSQSGADALSSIASDPARLRAYVAMLASNPAALARLQERDKTEIEELSKMKDVNQNLCVRVQQLRNECAATYRLIPGDAEKELACAAGNGEQTVLSAKWEVQLGTGRLHRLVIDNQWESTEFGMGTTTITWRPRAAGSSVAPRLIDLTSIQIVPVDGGAATELASFSLLANGTTVFGIGDVVRANESNGYFMVSMQRVLDLRSSAPCKISQAEFDSLNKGGE